MSANAIQILSWRLAICHLGRTLLSDFHELRPECGELLSLGLNLSPLFPDQGRRLIELLRHVLDPDNQRRFVAGIGLRRGECVEGSLDVLRNLTELRGALPARGSVVQGRHDAMDTQLY